MSTLKSSSADLTLNADGSGNDILFQSNASQVGSLTAEGLLSTTTVTASGVVTGATVEATGDTAAGDNAAIGYTAAEGLILTGQGSTNDITIKNDADATVLSVATGTTVGTFVAMPTISGVGLLTNGSNANGNYFKFADGTMICTVSKSVTEQDNGATAGAFYYSDTGTWTYPVAFSGSVRVVGNTEGGHYNAVSVKTPSVGTTSCTYVTISVNSTGNAQGLYLFAIGVWS